MPEQIQLEVNPHQQAEELLPWYATGQLGSEDRSLVEAHLSSCAHCRRQLGFDRRMIDEFAALTPEVDAGWARLRARLEPRRGRWDRAARQGAVAWRTLARPPVAAFALAQLLFVVLAGSVLLSLSRPDYRTLSSAPPPQSANVIAMFRSDTTESQLRSLLRRNGAVLVGGPTPADAYLLRVAPQSRQAVLGHLRGDRHVMMAQPIDGAAS